MDANPYKLKTTEVDWNEKEKPPSGYLNSSSFLSYLNRKGVEIERKDNLPRWANNNGVKMIKCTRQGRKGSVPTYYFPPSDSRMKEIIESQKNVNNSLLGKKTLENKAAEILEVFDRAQDASLFVKHLDALPKRGYAGYNPEIKRKRAAIVKEKLEKCESKASIAKKVAKSLSCDCNRKYVSKILKKHRSSQLDKKLLKKE